MSPLLSSRARRLGIVSASITVVLSVAYAVPLTAGLLSLPSPDAPIGEPWSAMMEILIILSMPAMVALMVAVHAWATPARKVFAAMAVVFMALTTVVTCSVHFVILTVSHRAESAGQPWLMSVLSFRWLSVTYALDILAWDVFFALSVLRWPSGTVHPASADHHWATCAGRARRRDPRRRRCPQHRHRRRLPGRNAPADDLVPPSRHGPSRGDKAGIS